RRRRCRSPSPIRRRLVPQYREPALRSPLSPPRPFSSPYAFCLACATSYVSALPPTAVWAVWFCARSAEPPADPPGVTVVAMIVERLLPTDEAYDLIALTRQICEEQIAPRVADDEAAERFPRDHFAL